MYSYPAVHAPPTQTRMCMHRQCLQHDKFENSTCMHVSQTFSQHQTVTDNNIPANFFRSENNSVGSSGINASITLDVRDGLAIKTSVL